MLVDVCTPGKDRDEQVREVALATAQAWLQSFVLPTKPTQGKADLAAVRQLTQTPFAASVEWTLRE